MKKTISKIIRIGLLVAILAAVLGQSIIAEDLYDARARQQELEQELANSQQRLEQLQANVNAAKAEVDKIDSEISEIQGIVAGYQAQSDEKQVQIDELQKQIDGKQEEIDAEYAAMSKRIKFMYENMGNSYIEAFFTSESFADALNKIQYLFELNNYDKKQMDKIQKLKDEMTEKQNEVISEQAAIDELKKAQEDQIAVLDEMLEVKAIALGDAMNEEQVAAEENAAIEAMLAEQRDVVNALVKEYEEKRRAEIGETGEIAYNGGPFIIPVPAGTYWISSPYGWRSDPFGGGYMEFHNGVDFAATINTPIYAAADGQVVISADGWNGGCGNYTVLYHGGGIYTEYMHQNYRIVEVGDIVIQGQTIGYVGTTGSSTGWHLHFGVVSSDHGFDYTQRIDPSPYLGL